MAGGGKGPAVMLIRGQAQYRNAYIIALSRKDLFGAVDAVVGMASLLPREANFTIPEPPKELLEKEVIDFPQRKAILRWLLIEKTKVERAVSGYVYKFYKSGSGTNSL